MENLNNSRVWSLPFSSFLTISTNSGGKYSNSAVVFHFFLSSSNIQTRIIFRVVLPKAQCVKLLRQKQTRWCQNYRFCIWLDSVHFSEFAFQLAPFIYIGYNLFTNSTSGNRKNAKLLKDKQFEPRKVTGAVVAYSSPVNKQVEISLFCTRHLIGWIWKCWNLLFQFCPVIGLYCLGGPGFSSRSVRGYRITAFYIFLSIRLSLSYNNFTVNILVSFVNNLVFRTPIDIRSLARFFLNK